MEANNQVQDGTLVRMRQRLDALRRRLRNRRGSKRGMSLVEIMVVIAIILTLMSVLAVGVFQVFGSAQEDMTVLQMGKVAERVEIHMLRKRNPPSTSEGLEIVYKGEGVPPDAWGTPFVYVSPGPNGEPFDLLSFGADKQEGGGDDIAWSASK